MGHWKKELDGFRRLLAKEMWISLVFFVCLCTLVDVLVSFLIFEDDLSLFQDITGGILMGAIISKWLRIKLERSSSQ